MFSYFQRIFSSRDPAEEPAPPTPGTEGTSSRLPGSLHDEEIVPSSGGTASVPPAGTRRDERAAVGRREASLRNLFPANSVHRLTVDIEEGSNDLALDDVLGDYQAGAEPTVTTDAGPAGTSTEASTTGGSRPAQPAETVRRNIRETLSLYWSAFRWPAFFWIHMTLNIVFFILIIVALTTSRQERVKGGDGLRTFLLNYLVYLLVYTPTIVYYGRRRMPSDPVMYIQYNPTSRLGKFMAGLTEASRFIFFFNLLVGFFAIQECKTCSVRMPFAYWLAKVICWINYFIVLRPLIIMLFLLMSVPFFLTLSSRLMPAAFWEGNTEQRGASQRVIDGVPLFRFVNEEGHEYGLGQRLNKRDEEETEPDTAGPTSTPTRQEGFPVKIASVDAKCSICLGKYKPVEQIRILKACRHHFHKTCVDEWFRISGRCPLCVRPIGPTAANETEQQQQARTQGQPTPADAAGTTRRGEQAV